MRRPYAPVATDEDDFLRQELHQHHDVLREQDLSIDALGDSVSRIGRLALDINEEVGLQNK